MPPRPTSAFVISITPFDEQGRLDEDALRAHLRRMAAAGIGVYVGGGGSGEGFTLNDAEARRVLEIGVEELQGRVAVRSMGVEPRMAQQMVDFAEMAAAVGVDATQIYSLDQGHGHRPTLEEIETYFTDILSQVSLPVALSTHQSVGYVIPVDMIEDLVARYDRIIGVNCSHADLSYLTAIIDAVGDRVDIHVGGPIQTLTALSLGAQGFLSSEANLAPRLCMSVLQRYAAATAHGDDGSIRQAGPVVAGALRGRWHSRHEGRPQRSGAPRRVPAKAAAADLQGDTGPGAIGGRRTGPGRHRGMGDEPVTRTEALTLR